MGYTTQAIKGISWLGILRITLRIISAFRLFIIIKILGLDQDQIGLFSIATITLAFIEMFTETGINVFLTQRKDSIAKYINTAWVISIVRGILISLTILLTIPLVTMFFDEPYLWQLLLLIAVVPVIRGFINPAVISFTRDLTFEKEFFYRATIFFVESVIAILCVILLRSSLGMIVGVIGGVIYEVALSHFLIRPRPTLAFDFKIFREIIHSGKWITLSGILMYAYQNMDTIIVGKMLGVGALGLYDTIYKISVVPITEFSDVVSRTALPILVRIEEDKLRFQKAVLRTLGIVTLGIIPLCLILAFLSYPLINLFLGEKWLGGVEVLQVLFILCIVRSVIVINNTVLLSQRRQDIVSVIVLVSLLVLLLTIVPLVEQFGMKGAAYAALLGSSVSLPVSIYVLYKQLFGETK